MAKVLTLYDYWRSSAAYRLRIALNLKGVSYESVVVNLHPDVAEHRSAAYRALNPQGRVPALGLDGAVYTQSMAILEWLEETYPKPPLLPEIPTKRLQARAAAQLIVSDIHPLNNPMVLGTLRQTFGASADQISDWYAKWIIEGFSVLEQQAQGRDTSFLFAEAPGMAEVCLIPQIYNARRFKVDISSFAALLQVEQACLALDPFKRAVPEAVKDRA